MKDRSHGREKLCPIERIIDRRLDRQLSTRRHRTSSYLYFQPLSVRGATMLTLWGKVILRTNSHGRFLFPPARRSPRRTETRVRSVRRIVDGQRDAVGRRDAARPAESRSALVRHRALEKLQQPSDPPTLSRARARARPYTRAANAQLCARAVNYPHHSGFPATGCTIGCARAPGADSHHQPRHIDTFFYSSKCAPHDNFG